MLKILPCLDSDELADSRRRELNIPHDVTTALGRSAVEAADNGYYVNRSGAKVDWSHYVQAACAAKVSIPPELSLPAHTSITFPETRVQVANETTLGAARRFIENGLNPLALNFADGVYPCPFGRMASALERVVNFSALFAAICLRPLTLPAVISLMYGAKGLSN
jgi:hypothetical protein